MLRAIIHCTTDNICTYLFYFHILFCLIFSVLSIAEGAICELEFCPCSIDPCLENEHTTLDDETRSASYFDDDSPALGDGSLVTGWYRFISSAGGDMPRFAPEPYSCQAKGPIWLDGKTIKCIKVPMVKLNQTMERIQMKHKR